MGHCAGFYRCFAAASPLLNRSHRHAHKRLMRKGFCVFQCAEVGADFGRRESKEQGERAGFVAPVH